MAFTTGSTEANQALFGKLEAARVKVSQRHDSLRVSPNFFNTDTEIDELLHYL